MANLTEESNFDEGVYQLELTDPVIGGPTGTSNKPLKNLANRTKWLKDAIASLATTVSDLSTSVTNALGLKAPLASPAFTGNPTAPTPSAGDADTSIATTAFVAAAVAAVTPDLSAYAPKASPTFTGDPKAPTPAQFDDDTSLATTAFVKRALGNVRGVLSYSGSPTLTADQVGNAIFFAGSGGNVATLPALSGAADGGVFYFKNLTSANVTIQCAGTDKLFVNNFEDTSITLTTGDDIYFVKGSSLSWLSFGGTAGLTKSGLLKAALNASGSAPIYACRAWVNFNGIGTVAIRASGNVTSIADNGIGDYTVNFTTAMPDANYSFAGSASRNSTSGTNGAGPTVTANDFVTARTSSAFRVVILSNAGDGSFDTVIDSSNVNINVFR